MAITLWKVTSLLERMGSRSVSDIHHFVPVVVGGASKLHSSYQEVMIGPLMCEFMGDEVSINVCPFISRCFRNIEHTFRDPVWRYEKPRGCHDKSVRIPLR